MDSYLAIETVLSGGYLCFMRMDINGHVSWSTTPESERTSDSQMERGVNDSGALSAN
jgi:hypothetical protein